MLLYELPCLPSTYESWLNRLVLLYSHSLSLLAALIPPSTKDFFIFCYLQSFLRCSSPTLLPLWPLLWLSQLLLLKLLNVAAAAAAAAAVSRPVSATQGALLLVARLPVTACLDYRFLTV